ncbi:MAG: DNA internalization-related competence protein ComEC/Rec2, partial [Burkholderiaceae bacterium]|nr:DNA internalization-related competence protein ComEC/Rec2 [Burkholderiaceae bacterium]
MNQNTAAVAATTNALPAAPPADAPRWRGRALVAVLLGVIAGNAAQVMQPALWSGAFYWLLLGLGVAGAWLAVASARKLAARWPGGWAAAGLWLLAAAALAFAGAGLRAAAYLQEALDPALEGVNLELTGVVMSMPQVGEAGQHFRFAAERAEHAGAPVRVPARLLLTWYTPRAGQASGGSDGSAAAPAPLRAGDRWRITVRLKAPHGNLNPHGFDYELWLWEQGIGATGYVRTGKGEAPPERLHASGQARIEQWRQTVRERLFDGVRASPWAPQQAGRIAGILAALAVGDQRAIERADWNTFRVTGVAHLMAISGLHITLFSWLAVGALGSLWRRSAAWGWRWCLRTPAPVAARLGGLLLAWAYAVFSGWGVPAQRTTLMLAVFNALALSGLRWPGWLNWLAVCAVVLLADPWALTQAGFWLSFVAVGILFAANPLDARAVAGGGAKARLARFLREQATVTLALAPLTLLLFGQVSLVSLLANCVAIPWITLVVTPLALAGALLPGLWLLAAWILTPLLAWLDWLAAWPWASVQLPAAPLVLAVAAVAGALVLVQRWPWALRLAGLPLMLPALLWQAPRPAHGQFDLLAADVGQGSAVLVRTAGHSLLFDAGPRFGTQSDAGQRVLTPLLGALGERPDRVVLSHRDSDHAGGAAAVLAQSPRTLLMASFQPDAIPALGHVTRCVAGQNWDWDGVRFTMLHPSEPFDERPSRTNAQSCVLHVRGAGGGDGAAALLTGDIEAVQERALAAQYPGALRADVLMAPHHGSKTSSSDALLQAVRPHWVLVQAGYRNRFGHPAPQVLARYALHQIQVADSPHCGAMHWHSARADQVQCERQT